MAYDIRFPSSFLNFVPIHWSQKIVFAMYSFLNLTVLFSHRSLMPAKFLKGLTVPLFNNLTCLWKLYSLSEKCERESTFLYLKKLYFTNSSLQNRMLIIQAGFSE